MNILVCLKMVSQSRFTDFLNENEADRLSAGQLTVNPADAYALEMALRIKDRRQNVTVTVLTMGPQYAEHILRTAIAMGADKAVHICDSAFAGSDTIMTAEFIGEAIKRLPPQDLILCGKKALDSETGHIGPQLGVKLNISTVTNVVSFTTDGNVVRMLSSKDKGMLELQGEMPLILMVCNGADMVRVPSIMGMRRSKNAEIELLNGAKLGITDPKAGKNGSGTETISVRNIKYEKRNHLSTDDITAGTEKLLSMLKQGGKNREK